MAHSQTKLTHTHAHKCVTGRHQVVYHWWCRWCQWWWGTPWFDYHWLTSFGPLCSSNEQIDVFPFPLSFCCRSCGSGLCRPCSQHFCWLYSNSTSKSSQRRWRKPKEKGRKNGWMNERIGIRWDEQIRKKYVLTLDEWYIQVGAEWQLPHTTQIHSPTNSASMSIVRLLPD